ncbi:hypothetical protein, partial [Weissella soli]
MTNAVIPVISTASANTNKVTPVHTAATTPASSAPADSAAVDHSGESDPNQISDVPGISVDDQGHVGGSPTTSPSSSATSSAADKAAADKAAADQAAAKKAAADKAAADKAA